MKENFRKYLILLSFCAVAVIGGGCEDNISNAPPAKAVSAGNTAANSAAQVNHRTPHTLAESFIKAVVAGDFDAVYETLSPDCRLRLDGFLAKENESRENWMDRLQKLWMIRLDTTDLSSVLQDNDLYIKFEKRLTQDEKMFIQLNGKWYFVFK